MGRLIKLSEEKLAEIYEKRKTHAIEYNEEKASKNTTTQEDIRALQEKLVQTCIDFINERNLGDLEIVSFNADSLQYSAKHGEWTPSTDSAITCEGIEMTEANKYYARVYEIGWSM